MADGTDTVFVNEDGSNIEGRQNLAGEDLEKQSKFITGLINLAKKGNVGVSHLGKTPSVSTVRFGSFGRCADTHTRLVAMLSERLSQGGLYVGNA